MKQQQQFSANLRGFLLLLFFLLWSSSLLAQVASYSIINTFAGGADSIPPTNGSRLARDIHGNTYLASLGNNKVFKIDLLGRVTHVAGNGSSAYTEGVAALSNGLVGEGIAVDNSGNIYLSLYDECKIVRIDAATSIVTTIAGIGPAGGVSSGDGGPAIAASIPAPQDIVIDNVNNILYIAQTRVIRKIDLSTGIISTAAGTNPSSSSYPPFNGNGGPATMAELGGLRNLAIDGDGNFYFSSIYTGFVHRILKVSKATGIMTCIAGNGTAGYSGDGGQATAAAISSVYNLNADTSGNIYFIDNYRIRKVDATTNTITTIAGNGTSGSSGDGGAATAAQIVAINCDLLFNVANGFLYFTQTQYPFLRKVDLSTGTMLDFFDQGPATNAYFAPVIRDVAVAQNGKVYIADGIGRIRKVDPATHIINTVAGGIGTGFSGDGGLAVAAQLNNPAGMALDVAGNLFIADRGNNRIRKVTTATGVISTIVGNGTATAPVEGAIATATGIIAPNDLVVDNSGNIYIASAGLHALYKVTAATGIINKIAGNGTAGFSGDNGPALSAQLNAPHGILLDTAGNLIFCDKSNHRIRKINLVTGIITTIAGTGTAGAVDGAALASMFNQPDDIAYDPAGNLLIADLGNNKMRLLDTDGNVYTVAGTGTAGFSGDGGQATAAMLNRPDGMSIAPDGKTYIADQFNGRVRTFTNPVIILPGTARIRLKVLLQGALLGNIPSEATLMRDNLRSSPIASGATYIPVADPYITAPLSASFTEVGDGLELGYRTIASPAVMFGDSATASVVDWVFVELRDKNNADSVLSTRSVLVRRNGLTVDVLGSDTLYFPSLPANDQYYVSVRHRNHLGAMTATALPSTSFNGSTLIDFSTMTNAQLWNNAGYDGLEQATVAPGVKALWAGNTNADVRVRFSGVGNDVGGIQSSVQSFSGNTAQSLTYTQAIGYFTGDVNMDSRVRYSGIGNDAAWIQSLIQNYISNTSQSLVYTGFLQQLP